MDALHTFVTIPLLAAVFTTLVMFGLMYFFWQSKQEKQARSEVRKRLEIKNNRGMDGSTAAAINAGKVANKVASKTDQFYSANDPVQKRKMQLRLIQAGYSNPNALGYFFAARFFSGFSMAALGVVYIAFFGAEKEITEQILTIVLMLTVGYFLPNLILNNQIKTRQTENRSGFPDVMDLMVVSAEAGLTTEGSIERIANEISRTHPVLSEQLGLAAIEIRAGKPLDEALRAFGERVGLDEVGGFATMIQQSKELGTSVSDALRVYSDEMRHKRMMAAEEKAYALPAKLSVPVTGFILPIVIGVAVVPTAVRMMTQ
ncbi:MAG: type II secretion system F family protein [Salaquimonas sp.]